MSQTSFKTISGRTVVKSVVSGVPLRTGISATTLLSDLTDVTITSVADNDLLQYNSVSGRWENIPPNTIIDSDISILQLQINNNDSDISTIFVSLANNDSDIEALQTIIAAQLDSADVLAFVQPLVDSNASDISALNTSVESLQTQIDGNDSDILALQNAPTGTDSAGVLAIVTPLIDSNASSISALRTSVDSDRGDLVSLQSQVDAWVDEVGLDSAQALSLITPLIDSNAADISTEILSRIAGDSDLQSNIDSNALDISTAFQVTSVLQAQIDSNYSSQIEEVANRVAGDSDLQSQIDAWVDTTGLDSAAALAIITPLIDSNASDIADEVSARIAGDASLQSQIDQNDSDILALQNAPSGTVDSAAVISIVQPLIDSNATDIVNLRSADITLQNNIDSNAARIAVLENAVDETGVDSAAVVSILQPFVDSNHADIVGLQTQILNNDSDIASLLSGGEEGVPVDYFFIYDSNGGQDLNTGANIVFTNEPVTSDPAIYSLDSSVVTINKDGVFAVNGKLSTEFNISGTRSNVNGELQYRTDSNGTWERVDGTDISFFVRTGYQKGTGSFSIISDVTAGNQFRLYGFAALGDQAISIPGSTLTFVEIPASAGSGGGVSSSIDSAQVLSIVQPLIDSNAADINTLFAALDSATGYFTLQSNIDSNALDIATEVAARIAADNTLQDNIDSNAGRISTLYVAGAGLQNSIDSNATDIVNLRSADLDLQANIDSNATDISAEITARISADSDLQSQIDAWVDEVGLDSAQALALITPLIDSNATDIFDEVAARIAADATLQNNIDSNATRIAALENAVDETGLDSAQALAIITPLIDSNATDISDEVAARIAGDGTLQSNIDSNHTDIVGLQTQIDGWVDETGLDSAAALAIITPLIDSNASDIQLLNSSVTSLEAADTTLQGNIDSNHTDIVGLQGQIDAWVDTTGLDSAAALALVTPLIDSNALDIATEVNARIAADNALQDNIDSNALDISTAFSVTSVLQAQIDSNGLAIAGVIQSVENNDSDIVALQANIDSNASDIESINSSIASLEAADTTLQGNIDSNASDIESINTSISSLLAADITLQSNIDSNADRIAVLENAVDETGLDSAQALALITPLIDSNALDISNEVSARIAGDNSLQTSIDSNANDIEGINTSIAGLEAADTTLQSNIDSNHSDIVAEISARMAGDTTLQTNIDSNASDIESINTSISALQNNIDSNATDISDEVAARIAADATLQSNIDSNHADIAALASLPSGIDSAQAITLIDGRVDSDDFVKLTGTQSIDGVKTFTDPVTIRNSLTLYDSANATSAITTLSNATLTTFGDANTHRLLTGATTLFEVGLTGAKARNSSNQFRKLPDSSDVISLIDSGQFVDLASDQTITGTKEFGTITFEGNGKISNWNELPAMLSHNGGPYSGIVFADSSYAPDTEVSQMYSHSSTGWLSIYAPDTVALYTDYTLAVRVNNAQRTLVRNSSNQMRLIPDSDYISTAIAASSGLDSADVLGFVQPLVDSNASDIESLRSADTALQANIDSNALDISTAFSVTSILQAQIDSNASDIGSINSSISTIEASVDSNALDIATEVNARITADNTLQNNIDSNANDIEGINTSIAGLEAADTTLQGNIDSNANDIEGIKTSIAGLEAADITLQGNIDSNASDIAIEIAARISADSTLQSNIDSNATDIGNRARLDVAETFTETVTFTGISESVHALSGTTPALSVADGTIKTWTLTGNSTPTDGLSAGQSITLMIDDGSSYTITWPTMVWVNNGGSAPELATSGYTVVGIWKVGSTLYGALVGDGS